MTPAHLHIVPSTQPQTAINTSGPRLRPHTHPLVSRLLANPAYVHQLADAFGSPLNIMFPQVISETIASFQQVYKKNHLGGRIFFTTKPNKSMAIKRQAAMADVGADVSSHKSLLLALEAGFDATRIEATGPKNMEYLTLILQQNVILNADNFTELEQALALRKTLGLRRKTRLFVRLSGFRSTRVNFTRQDGTFGIHVDEAPQIFTFLKNNADHFDFQGFSYYVSSATNEQRTAIIEQALKLTMEAMKLGLQPKGLDIGGGFHVQYAASREEWAAYTDMLKKSLVDDSVQQMTWNNNGLGYRNVGGLISGAPMYMDHYAGKFGATDLDAFLNVKLPTFGNQTAAEVLSENMLDLYIEPGRSMLDQTGITVARVNHVKQSVYGETLVALDMNRSNMHSSNLKLLTEPVLLPRNPSANKPYQGGVYYIGNLCVSYDIIQYNKTFPDHLPEAGDLVAFINTGPYIMDFIESETLHQRTADRVAVVDNGKGFSFFQDHMYQPAIEQTFNQ